MTSRIASWVTLCSKMGSPEYGDEHMMLLPVANEEMTSQAARSFSANRLQLVPVTESSPAVEQRQTCETCEMQVNERTVSHRLHIRDPVLSSGERSRTHTPVISSINRQTIQ